MTLAEHGPTLLRLARAAIAQALGEEAQDEPAPPALLQPGASFVTLTQRGDLRGCMGTLEAHRPLADDVRHNAVASALRDPRFTPLTRDEFGYTRVEVSVLSNAAPLAFADEADALAQLRPEVDGIILECDWHRATFLPQVWEQLPDPREFLGHLKRKAGLPAHYWSERMRLSRYGVEKFKE